VNCCLSKKGLPSTRYSQHYFLFKINLGQWMNIFLLFAAINQRLLLGIWKLTKNGPWFSFHPKHVKKSMLNGQNS
jgi:hypothetical protein